ncbi:transmembrane protein 50, partial [Trifolium pratense]
RLKLWLFIAYVVSFVSLAGSAGMLIQDSLDKSAPSVWTGVAGVLQCVFVLISGLIYWTAHPE